LGVIWLFILKFHYDSSTNKGSQMPRTEPTHPIDVNVGKRVRLRRRMLGLSQTQLADHLGITFQQVQKYELGSNRISASKLFEIAEALRVPVNYFFQDVASADAVGDLDEAPAPAVDDVFGRRETTDLIRGYYAIGSSRARAAVMQLVRSLAADGDDLPA
jgi:transcriptional regulator with XRE-family HTH domain